MAAWLSRIASALTALLDPKRRVRLALQSAADGRAKVSLELASGRAAHVTTVVEQVREEDVIIAQPIVDGQVYPLAFGEKVRMGFLLGPTYYSGSAHCLGRIKFPPDNPTDSSNLETLVFAYRLSLPSSLDKEDPRTQPRVKLFESPIDAQLYLPGEGGGSVVGRLIDLNMTGARVASLIRVSWLAPGKTAFLKIMLPEPVGLLDELVGIARVESAAPGQEQVVGIKFRRRINGLAEFIRANQTTAPQARRKSA